MENLTNKFKEVEHPFMKIVRNIIENKSVEDLKLDVKNAWNKYKTFQDSFNISDIDELMEDKAEKLKSIIIEIINCNDRLRERENILDKTNVPSIIDKYNNIIDECNFDLINLIETDTELLQKLDCLYDDLHSLKEKFFIIKMNYKSFNDNEIILEETRIGEISLALIIEMQNTVTNIIKILYGLPEKTISTYNVIDIAKLNELFYELKYKLFDVRYCCHDNLYWIDVLENINEHIKNILETKISCKNENGYGLEDYRNVNITKAKTIEDIVIQIHDLV